MIAYHSTRNKIRNKSILTEWTVCCSSSPFRLYNTHQHSLRLPHNLLLLLQNDFFTHYHDQLVSCTLISRMSCTTLCNEILTLTILTVVISYTITCVYPGLLQYIGSGYVVTVAQPRVTTIGREHHFHFNHLSYNHFLKYCIDDRVQTQSINKNTKSD